MKWADIARTYTLGGNPAPCGKPILTREGKLLGFCERPRGHKLTPHTYLMSDYAVLRERKMP